MRKSEFTARAEQKGFVPGARFKDLVKGREFTVADNPFKSLRNVPSDWVGQDVYVDVAPNPEDRKTARIYSMGYWAEIIQPAKGEKKEPELRFKIGDTVTFKKGPYCFWHFDEEGKTGKVIRYHDYNSDYPCHRIEVECSFHSSLTMLESEFEEYDKPQLVKPGYAKRGAKTLHHQALLIEAEKNYPEGTKYYSVSGHPKEPCTHKEVWGYHDSNNSSFITDGWGGVVWQSDKGWAKKVEQLSQEVRPDPKEELLAEAKRKYPIGTKVKGFISGDTYTIVGVPKVESLKSVICTVEGSTLKEIQIFTGYQWAEIIQDEKPVSKLPNHFKIWTGNNPDLSRRVQEKLFELGHKWGLNERRVMYTDSYALFSDNLTLSFLGNDRKWFDKNTNVEITPADLGIYESANIRILDSFCYPVNPSPQPDNTPVTLPVKTPAALGQPQVSHQSPVVLTKKKQVTKIIILNP
jgi:hypothetical protein